MNIDELEQQIRDLLTEQAAMLDGRPHPSGRPELREPNSGRQRLASRRSWLPGRGGRSAPPRVVAIAAAITIAAGFAITFGAERSDTVTVETPPSEGAADEATGANQRTDLLLPPDNQWVAVAHEVSEAEPAAEAIGTQQSVAWEVGDGLVLLGVFDSGPERNPLTEADRVDADNATSLMWDVDGERLRLTAIDVPEADPVDIAQSLTRTGDGWTLSMGRLIHRETVVPIGTEQEQTEFAAIGADGDIDLSAVVTQSSGPGTLGSLYLDLGEAVSLGSTESVTIGGGTGFVVTGVPAQYATAYRDGYVSSWQAMGSGVDVAAFVASLEPVNPQQWAAAMADADDNRRAEIEKGQQEAVDAAEASLAEQPTSQVPRLVLPAPWQPTRVFDDSLWTDEERAHFYAGQPPMTGWSDPVEFVWDQTLRRKGAADDAIPEVLIRVELATGPRPALPTDQPPIALAGFKGYVMNNDGTAELRVRNGDITIAATAPGLTADELASILTALPLRSQSGEDGFDLTGSPFTTGVDGPPPALEPDVPNAPSSSWSATWELDDRSVHLELFPISAHAWETNSIDRARQGTVEVFDTAEGEILQITLNESDSGGEGPVEADAGERVRGRSRLTWWRPAGSDSAVMIVGGYGSDIDHLAIIDQLRAVSDEEWAEIMSRVLLPFDDEPN